MNVQITCIFGTKELQTRIRPEGNRFIGEGRTRLVDQNGFAHPWSEWEPTGAVMTCADDHPQEPAQDWRSRFAAWWRK
jgi:hypothetical protein